MKENDLTVYQYLLFAGVACVLSVHYVVKSSEEPQGAGRKGSSLQTREQQCIQAMAVPKVTQPTGDTCGLRSPLLCPVHLDAGSFQDGPGPRLGAR